MYSPMPEVVGGLKDLLPVTAETSEKIVWNPTRPMASGTLATGSRPLK